MSAGGERTFGVTLELVEVDTSDRRALTARWSDGAHAVLHVLWLRDNCPSGGDKASAIRTFSVADLDPSILIASAGVAEDCLNVEFSDGHQSKFEGCWLRREGGADTSLGSTVRTWKGSTGLDPLDFQWVRSAKGHHQLLEALVAVGAVVVHDVPRSPEGTEALAQRLGHVRETDFGRMFDIVSEPEVWELSQSTDALDPHTDDPYRYTPSGASILHCIEASDDGGRSVVVDGFAVTESLRADRPEAFEILASTPVPWIRHRSDAVEQGEAVHLRAHAPIIRLDAEHEVAGIRFHERSLGPLHLEPVLIGPFYDALIEFTRRIRSSDFQWEQALAPGEALVFDNQRVLHGRTAFASTGLTSRRHLRLCTVDREQAHSKLRLLRARFAPGTERGALAAGNLA